MSNGSGIFGDAEQRLRTGRNHYEFLGLSRSATREELQDRILQLQREAELLSQVRRGTAEQIVDRLRTVREDLLAGPEARTAYDRRVHLRLGTGPTEGREDVGEPRGSGLYAGQTRGKLAAGGSAPAQPSAEGYPGANRETRQARDRAVQAPRGKQRRNLTVFPLLAIAAVVGVLAIVLAVRSHTTKVPVARSSPCRRCQRHSPTLAPTVPPKTGLALSGAARFIDGREVEVAPPRRNAIGSVFSEQHLSSGKDFQTTFTIWAHGGTNPPGIGLTFVLEPYGPLFIGHREDLGLSSGKSIALAFQLYGNLSEPRVDELELFPDARYSDPTRQQMRLVHMAQPIHVRVSYNSRTRQLSVFSSANAVEAPRSLHLRGWQKLFVSSEDLRTLGPWVYAGFTAETKSNTAAFDVVTWQVNQSVKVPAKPD